MSRCINCGNKTANWLEAENEELKKKNEVHSEYCNTLIERAHTNGFKIEQLKAKVKQLKAELGTVQKRWKQDEAKGITREGELKAEISRLKEILEHKGCEP